MHLLAYNIVAIPIAINLIFHERMKHIAVDYHYIWEAFDDLVITLPHVSSKLQVADVFTKAVPRPRHQFLVHKFLLVHSPGSI